MKTQFRGTEVKTIILQGDTGERERNCIEVVSKDVTDTMIELFLNSYTVILLSETPEKIKMKLDRAVVELEKNDYYEIGYKDYSLEIDPSIILGIMRRPWRYACDIELTEEQKAKVFLEEHYNSFEENYDDHMELLTEIFGEELVDEFVF